ncbi:MAG: AMP-binding protein [Gallionella sp.]|nr:AMP-binding protein [Gallionella sp.]
MNLSLIASLRLLAQKQPDALACVGISSTLTYQELIASIDQFSTSLTSHPAQVIGLALDNSPLWAVLDLAAWNSHKTLIPIPFFFSAEQVAHSIRDAGITCIWTDQAELYTQLLRAANLEIGEILTHQVGGQSFTEIRLSNVEARILPTGTIKVTYTSGTTGHPKGVCLSADTLYQVASSLLAVTHGIPQDQHLSILPLATLLENLAGIYVPLLAGATCHLVPLAEVGLSGSSTLNVQKMLGTLLNTAASTTILTPQLLHALVVAIEMGHPAPAALRFIAIGGAPVSARLLQRAHALGLPVFEGYGLSECASVVALNSETEACLGSVGKPLPHVQLKFAEDGEVLVSGATFLGYTHDESDRTRPFWPTGDIGYLDQQGYLHLTGRKKNIFITSFGRNVSPEWVERELTLHPAIAQAAVFGEARPWNVAVIVPRSAEALPAIENAIAETNRVLPDYAQIKKWIIAQVPFLPQNGQMTPNGRLKRDVILTQYQAAIDALYAP